MKDSRPFPQRLRSFRRLFLAVALGMAFETGTPTVRADNVPLDLLKESNQRLHRFVLDNGIVGLIKEDHSAPVVSVQIWVGTGSADEQEYLGSGLCHAIEHMIFKGTPQRKIGDITREINDVGGDINAYTSVDRTVFHTDLPSAHWKTGLDVLADAVSRAVFPKMEWDKERQVILREIAMGRDDQNRTINHRLWQTAFRVHPYRHPVIGYKEVFETVTQQDIVTFFNRNYRTDNMIVSIAGDIHPGEVETAIRSLLGPLPRKAHPSAMLPPEPPQMAPREHRETGVYTVTRLRWAYPGVALHHPDAPALDMLAEITGHGRSSRLNIKLREQLRLVHEISAWSYTPKDPGLWGVSALFNPDKEKEVEKAIQEEITSWQTRTFTRAEIAKARRTLLTSVLSELQTMKGQADSHASGEFYAGDPFFSQTYLQAIETVTAADLQRVARQYLQPSARTRVILAPARASATAEQKQESPDPRPVITKTTLSNGMTLLVREDRRLPFVSLCAAFQGGLLSETADNSGITRLMSELLVLGTRSRSAAEIAEQVESRGGRLSPFSGQNSFGLQARCLSPDKPFFFKLLADCLLNPAFPEDELAKQKMVQLAEIGKQEERPFFIAQQQLKQHLFPDHPYRWDPLGSRESVESLSRDDIRNHTDRHITASNLVLAVFGDITEKETRELAETHFRKLARGPRPVLETGAAQPQLPARVSRREPREQAILLFGFPGITVHDPRNDALAVLASAMSGLSSDLAMTVREERGLAYYVGSYHQPGLAPGAFVMYAGTREDKAGEVEDLFRAELKRLASPGLRTNELDRARNQIMADHDMQSQDNSALAFQCALDELYGLGYEHALKVRERFAEITSEKIREAARQILSGDHLAVSIVLPEGKP